MDLATRTLNFNPPARPEGSVARSAAARQGAIRPASAPATPQTPAMATAQPPEGTPSGSWKHPHFDEITRRQNAANFDETHVKSIVANASVLFLSFVAPRLMKPIDLLQWVYKPLAGWIGAIPYLGATTYWGATPYFWIVNSLRLLLVANIYLACSPLYLRYYPDDLADIPLTPSQRQMMGLDPDVSTPQTPGSAYASPNYVTPPRYQKSTPRGSFSNQDEHSSQYPLSGSPRPRSGSMSNSPFSPSNTSSPLLQKAFSGNSAKRLSFAGSTLGSSFFSDSSSSTGPGTPTPGGGKASVGLNNKWLYDKRRESPRSNMFN